MQEQLEARCADIPILILILTQDSSDGIEFPNVHDIFASDATNIASIMSPTRFEDYSRVPGFVPNRGGTASLLLGRGPPPVTN